MLYFFTLLMPAITLLKVLQHTAHVNRKTFYIYIKRLHRSVCFLCIYNSITNISQFFIVYNFRQDLGLNVRDTSHDKSADTNRVSFYTDLCWSWAHCTYLVVAAHAKCSWGIRNKQSAPNVLWFVVTQISWTEQLNRFYALRHGRF